jgi:2-oxoglutarate dehydrogenase E2 component (dihydrolipoamide succinyltransferase)
MSVSVEVPALGESITEAIVAEWRKAVGQFVARDEILVELETDKITVEVPSPISGTIEAINAEADDTVNVGDVIARITPSDRPAAEASEESQKASPDEEQIATATTQTEKAPSNDALSPAVRRLLEERGLSPTDVQGSGPQGRILKGDVLSHSTKKPTDAAPVVPLVPLVAPRPSMADQDDESVERVRMTRLRQTVARRLVEAQQSAAILTTFNEADMSGVIALRARYKDKYVEKYGIKLGFMSFFVKACVDALKMYPAVNAEIDDKHILFKNFYHIGVAVGGGKGLVVPVIRHADRLGFAGVELEISRLAKRAMNNQLSLPELQGGTFTISNGGVYGSMLSTPILNPPQVAILGMHNIIERPIAVDGQVVIRPMMNLALSYDHRLIDGREAVRFLIRIKECIENPERLILEI